MKSVKHQRRGGATTAGFALQIVNTPGRPARQGSTDELAALGLDALACLVVGCINQGEASLRIREQTLYNRGILMEDNFEPHRVERRQLSLGLRARTRNVAEAGDGFETRIVRCVGQFLAHMKLDTRQQQEIR